MSNFEYLTQGLQITLGVVLIARLLALRLHVVYKLFSFFLAVDVISSVVFLFQHYLNRHGVNVDYRLTWVAERSLMWTLMIVTVYALLGAVLENLPGILRFSRRFLNSTFAVAFLVVSVSAIWEYRHSDYGSYTAWEDRVLFGGLLSERMVSSLVLLVIIGILFFLLWFPVQIPRNLALFIVGFSIYSAGTSIGLLFQSLAVRGTSRPVSISIELLMCTCTAYWAIFITQAGERVVAKLNVRRDPQEEDRLLKSLEQINDALLHSASRLPLPK